MAKALTLWRAEVESKIRGAGSDLVIQEVRAAVKRWCEITLKYHAELAPINIVGDTAVYGLTAPDLAVSGDQVIAGVVSVRLATDDLPLPLATKPGLDVEVPGWRKGTTGAVQYALVISGGTTSVQLVRTPAESVTAGLIVDAAFAPSDSAASVADELFIRQETRDAISNEALSRLHGMHQKPWSNPQASAALHAMFLDACHSADVDSLRGYSRAPLRVSATYR